MRSIHSLPALLATILLGTGSPGQAQTPAVTWEERIEIAAGDAYQGPWRMNESQFLYVDDPTVAINETGIIAIAWADNARRDVMLQILEADGTQRFDTPVNVSRSPNVFSWLPRLVMGRGNASEVHVLWQEIVFSGGSHGGEIFFARSTDGGRTFAAPLNLSNTTAGAGKGRLDARYWHNGSLDLAMGGDGRLYAAWTEYEGSLRFSRSTDRGASFSEPLHIAGDHEQPARGPTLAVTPRGDIHLAWTVGEDPAADIYFTRSADRDSLSFSTPRVVHHSAGHADAPKLAVDGKGTVHLVYGESPAGPLERYHIRYTRSTDGGAGFATPREISGPQQFAGANFPALGLDGEDNLHVTWELFPGRQQRSLGLGFTTSIDAGRTFAPPAVIPGSLDPALGINGSLQGLLMNKLAVSETGTIAVVNSTFMPNEHSHIWLYRGRTGYQVLSMHR